MKCPKCGSLDIRWDTSEDLLFKGDDKTEVIIHRTFECAKCGHIWEAEVFRRENKNKKRRRAIPCPKCGHELNDKDGKCRFCKYEPKNDKFIKYKFKTSV